MNLLKLNPLDGAIYKTGRNGRVFIFNQGWMFDPVTLMVAGGTALGAYGQYQGGLAAEAEGKTQQNMANYNAALQEREAKQIEAQTAMQQKQQAEEASRTASTLRAGLGASGAVSTAGSPLMIMAKQASQSELENLNIGYQGMEQATAARSGAALSRMEGLAARQKGRAGKTAGFLGAGSTLLTGFGTAGYYGRQS